MYEQKLKSFSQLPVREKNRKCTDVICTIISAIFAITMLVLAFVLMNKQNYYKTNFPTDSDGQPCAYGQNQQYDFVYFPEIDDLDTRVCVNSCPTVGGTIACRQNLKVQDCMSVNTYESSAEFDRLGGFCVPTDHSARQKLIKNANIQQKWSFLNSYDTIRISLLIALGLGLLWLVVVQMCPKVMAPGAILLGSLALLLAAVVLLLDRSKGWQGKDVWRILIAIACIFFALLFSVMLCLYRRRIKVVGILLSHSTSFLMQQPLILILIPIFILFTVGLIVLCLFQYLAYSSHSSPETQQNDLYLHIWAHPVLTILNIFEFIWGMQFLKDTFNFLISGNVTEWYTQNGKTSSCLIPLKRLMCRNWGSVVGGSLLNAFFNFFDFLWETFRCYPEGMCGKLAPCCTSLSKICCCNFYDLVRNDAYAYINLTGIPYCNSARNCQVLCQQSRLFIGNQSVMFFYRLCAHAFCVGATTLIAYFILKSRIGGINIKTLIIILVLTYCIVTYFIDIHADAAQALQVSYLTELELSGGNPDALASNYEGLKGELRGLDQSSQDSAC